MKTFLTSLMLAATALAGELLPFPIEITLCGNQSRVSYPCAEGYNFTVQSLSGSQWRALPGAPHNSGFLMVANEVDAGFFRVDATAFNTLTNGLVAHWRLDETNGLRFDATGRGNNLSEGLSATVGSTNGILTNAAYFVLDPTNLSYLAAASAGGRGDFAIKDGDLTIAGWVNCESPDWYEPVDGFLALVNGQAGLGYKLSFFGSNLVWNVRSNSVASSPVPRAAWNFFAVYHDSTNDVIGISMNGGAAAEVAHTNGIGGLYGQFILSQKRFGSYGFIGSMDSISMWRRRLTGAEIGQLWNGGAGLDPTK